MRHIVQYFSNQNLNISTLNTYQDILEQLFLPDLCNNKEPFSNQMIRTIIKSNEILHLHNLLEYAINLHKLFLQSCISVSITESSHIEKRNQVQMAYIDFLQQTLAFARFLPIIIFIDFLFFTSTDLFDCLVVREKWTAFKIPQMTFGLIFSFLCLFFFFISFLDSLSSFYSFPSILSTLTILLTDISESPTLFRQAFLLCLILILFHTLSALSNSFILEVN